MIAAAEAVHQELSVIKRNGNVQEVSFDKIVERIRAHLDPTWDIPVLELVQRVIHQLTDRIHTSQIDELVAQECIALVMTHPDYGELASRITISNHHKNTHVRLQA